MDVFSEKHDHSLSVVNALTARMFDERAFSLSLLIFTQQADTCTHHTNCKPYASLRTLLCHDRAGNATLVFGGNSYGRWCVLSTGFPKVSSSSSLWWKIASPFEFCEADAPVFAVLVLASLGGAVTMVLLGMAKYSQEGKSTNAFLFFLMMWMFTLLAPFIFWVLFRAKLPAAGCA